MPVQDHLNLIDGRIGMHRLDAEETLPVSRDVISRYVVRAEQVPPFEQRRALST